MIYTTLLIDPPWTYRNVKTGGSHTSGSAQKYQTIPTSDVANMPVSSIAARDSVCFLWATTPLGGDPYAVLSAWGFTFKTEWYWHKIGRKGTGYWTRGCVEKLLIGTRGSVKAWRSNVDNYFATIPQGHSRKPAIARLRIEQLASPGPRVELFSTQPEIPGWDHYGLSISQTHDVLSQEFWTKLRAT